MTAIAAQRCLHHASREAAGRCPECSRTFCRECITEHEGRIICADCLAKLTRPVAAKPRRKLHLLPAAGVGSGVLSAWIFFYIIGKLLVALPNSFHEGTVWTEGLLEQAEE
jgi:hypothetical protein